MHAALFGSDSEDDEDDAPRPPPPTPAYRDAERAEGVVFWEALVGYKKASAEGPPPHDYHFHLKVMFAPPVSLPLPPRIWD